MDQDEFHAAARFRQLANVALVADMADFNRPGEVHTILPELAQTEWAGKSWKWTAIR